VSPSSTPSGTFVAPEGKRRPIVLREEIALFAAVPSCDSVAR
jgi:hypothetical protein